MIIYIFNSFLSRKERIVEKSRDRYITSKVIYKIARFIHHFERAINIPFITNHLRFCYSYPISNEILRRSKVLEGELSSTGSKWDEVSEYRATERLVEERRCKASRLNFWEAWNCDDYAVSPGREIFALECIALDLAVAAESLLVATWWDNL